MPKIQTPFDLSDREVGRIAEVGFETVGGIATVAIDKLLTVKTPPRGRDFFTPWQCVSALAPFAIRLTATLRRQGRSVGSQQQRKSDDNPHAIVACQQLAGRQNRSF